MCRTCLMYRSQRCPMGGCWDDERARREPYPRDDRRAMWTDHDKPGEGAHWCRGGMFYSLTDARMCPRYVAYDPDRHAVRDCLEGVVETYQDGYVKCSLIDVTGCEECMRRFERRHEDD